MRKMYCFGVLIPNSNLILLYGRKLLSYNILRKLAIWRNSKIEERILRIIGKVEEGLLPIQEVNNAPIWYCWLQGEESLPPVPKLCLKSIRRFANGHPVVVLTSQNYGEFVKLPERIVELYHSGIISPAHFSDILRMALLSQRGGFWMDATMFVVRPLPESIFDSLLFTIKTPPSGFFVSECRWTGFCMFGWQYNPLAQEVSRLFEEYWQKTNCLIDYFMIDYAIDLVYKQNKIVKKMVDDIPYNNQNVHQLSPLLCRTFQKNNFEELTKNTYLFKLNWRKYSKRELESDSNNYYHFLNTLVD